MIKKSTFIVGLILSISSFQAGARDFSDYDLQGRGRGRGREEQGSEERRGKNRGEPREELSEGSEEDAEVIQAVERRRRVDFVEGRGMVVTRLLPDDNSGLRHQKWIVRLSNGASMQAVYNLDLCERVDLQVGDKVAMGGQFVWTNQGALLHWLHYDPRERRPDGYVEVNGKVYCGDGERHR